MTETIVSALPSVEPIHRELYAEAARAIKEYRRSAEGQAELQALRDKGMEDVRDHLARLLLSPRFARTRELVDEHNRISISNPIKALSLGNPSTRTWASNKAINGSDATGRQLAACVFNGQLYLFWRSDDDQRMYFSASSNNSWPTGKTINVDETTSQGPAACAYDGQLFVFFASNDPGQLLRWTSSASGTSWPASTIVNNAAAISSVPAAMVYYDNLYVFFTETSGDVCYAASQPV